jgi:HrpA-like RNA helicase
MRLAAPERDDVVATTSKHEQQRKEKKFVRQLVQRYERTRLQQTYNSAEDAVSYNDSAERRSVISVATGNVRLEIAEAIFISKKNDSKKKTKSKLPFQTGTRKVMVVSRSTTIDELCKQAKSKLHIKTAPTRAFVVQDSSSFAIFHLKNDLAGVEDGTTIYVTSAAKDSGRDEDKDCQSEELSSSTPEEDPLAQVKRAYATQERQRRIQRTLASSADTTPRIDADKAAQMAKQRSNLPAWACRSDILAASNVHSVVVLSGATGSGKSTQVPQFFWEQMREENDDSPRDNLRPRYIVVTQPRRVAAISLAQRVAEETGSASPGKRGSLVGYIVRLDRKVADETCRIIYCTVGVLLRMLVSPRGQRNGDSKDSLPPLSMDTISHVILDEVHERDVNTDFSLTLLRGLLASKRYPQLRLILMSATASADFFVDYFASVTSAPPKSLEIPGRTFPVKVNWISDCEKFSGARCQKSDRGLSSRETSDESSLSLSPRAYQKIDNILVRSLIGKIVLNQQSDGELKVSSAFARERSTGAILVFLPGKAEIDSLARSLYENKQLTGDRNICNILKLYSSMPRNEQQAVFQPARVGTVKIVLATNVAE